MTRELPQPQKRKTPTPKMKAEVLIRQEGKCAGCGDTLGRGTPYHFDHIQPLDSLGSNDVENLQALCKPCHKIKTAQDVKAIAKGRRLRGETGTSKQSFKRPPKGYVSPLSKNHRNYRKQPIGRPA